MSLKTNDIIIHLLNNQLHEVKQLLVNTTPGDIDKLSPETIQTLTEHGYTIDEKALNSQFLLYFVYLWWLAQETNTERAELFNKVMDAYAKASLPDYLEGILLLGEITHPRNEAFTRYSGLVNIPRHARDALRAKLFIAITETLYPHEIVQAFINTTNRSFDDFLPKEVSNLIPIMPKSLSRGGIDKPNASYYNALYTLVKYNEAGVTLLTAITLKKTFKQEDEIKAFFGCSRLEQFYAYAIEQDPNFKFQLPFSEERLLGYLTTNRRNISDRTTTQTNRNFFYKKIQPNVGEITAFCERYDLLVKLGLRPETIKTRLTHEYLCGVTVETQDFSRKTTHHEGYLFWQMQAFLTITGLTVNDPLPSGDKPIIHALKQDGSFPLEYFIDFCRSRLVFTEDDIMACIAVLKAEHKEKYQYIVEEKILKILTLLGEDGTLPFFVTRVYHPSILRFLTGIQQLDLSERCIKKLQEAEEKIRAIYREEAAIQEEIALDQINAQKTLDALIQAERDRIEGRVPLIDEPNEETNMQTEPNDNRPVNHPYDFRTAFLQFTREHTMGPEEKENFSKHKQILLNHLLLPAVVIRDCDYISTILQELKDTTRFKALKEELIAYVLADATRKQDIQTARREEDKNEHKFPQTYLTYILGLGRSGFDFKETKSLIKLDIELGIKEKPSMFAFFSKKENDGTTSLQKSITKYLPF